MIHVVLHTVQMTVDSHSSVYDSGRSCPAIQTASASHILSGCTWNQLPSVPLRFMTEEYSFTILRATLVYCRRPYSVHFSLQPMLSLKSVAAVTNHNVTCSIQSHICHGGFISIIPVCRLYSELSKVHYAFD